MPSERFKARARWWVQNPLVSLIAFVLVAVVLAHRPDAGGAGGRPRIYVIAVRQENGFRIIDPDNDSWDEAARLLREAPGDVTLISYEPQRSLEGMLAPTREVVEKEVEFGPSEIGLDRPRGSRARAREAFVAWLRAARCPHRADADEIGAGDVRRVTTLWAGYVQNALAAGAFALLLYSLLWINRIPGWMATTRRQRALARGRCPSCGYAIAGLPGTVCPECGRSWEARAGDALVGGAERT